MCDGVKVLKYLPILVYVYTSTINNQQSTINNQQSTINNQHINTHSYSLSMHQVSFAMSDQDLQVVIVLALVIVGFIVFWFTSESRGNKTRFFQKYDEDRAKVRWVFFQKYTGVLFLGILPLIITLLFLPYALADYGLGFQNTLPSLGWICALAAVIIPLNINAAKRPQNLAMYPMIRVNTWDMRLVWLNALATISYLFAYELLFRGILLMVCVQVLGVWPAIAINVALYSAVHLPKGPPETIGAIPFGILICYITLTTGTIWVAVVVHVILSLSNDYLSVYYHPHMRYTSKP